MSQLLLLKVPIQPSHRAYIDAVAQAGCQAAKEARAPDLLATSWCSTGKLRRRGRRRRRAACPACSGAAPPAATPVRVPRTSASTSVIVEAPAGCVHVIDRYTRRAVGSGLRRAQAPSERCCDLLRVVRRNGRHVSPRPRAPRSPQRCGRLRALRAHASSLSLRNGVFSSGGSHLYHRGVR